MTAINVNHKSKLEAYVFYIGLFQLSLSKREKECLAGFCIIHDVLKDMGVKEPYRSTIVFSTEKRQEVANMLNTSMNTINTLIGTLRKKGVVAGNEINKRLMFNPSIKFNITYE